MQNLNTRSLTRLILALSFVCFVSQISISAATFSVNTLLNNEANGCGVGNCTLREAINDANAIPGDDTIVFQSGLMGTITPGALGITTNIAIIGPGPRVLTVTNASGRVFLVSGAGVTASISGLSITGNNLGGGISNTSGATLNLSEVALTNNRSSLGGGVSTQGGAVTNITRSLISNNAATAGGGGLDVQIPGTVVTITNSTITNNSAVNAAGGVGNIGATVNLINVTVSHNTVTADFATGGGIGNFNAGTVNMQNTIVSDNTRAGGFRDDFSGFPPTSFGGNVIPQSGGVLPFGNPNSDGDRIGSSSAFPPVIITTLLGPLQNNGGITDTRALGAGSPAIDFGNNCVVTASCSGLNPVAPMVTDQRGEGFPRRRGSRVDSGAFEAFSSTVFAPTSFDFDGDSKTDIGIFRPVGAVSEWWINRSGNGQTFALQFGSASDVIAPADYTGDGRTDIAFFRPSTGEWYVLRSEDFSFFALPFGTNGDVPFPADYDADGKADFAVFRPGSSTWFISQSAGAPTRIEQFGVTGDVPVVADYDGDGKADIAIFRAAGSGAEWWISRSTAGLLAMQFGASSDKAVQGDYTGDGKADVAIWRPATGEWFIVRSEDLSFFGFPFGASTDIVSPGDYDGDGKFDPGVFRPSNATWFVGRSTGGTQIVQFGATGDRPIPNSYVP